MLSLRSPGATRELHLDQERHNEDQWIRAIRFLPNNEFLIVLCTNNMAKAILSCIHLEMDISFKMVAGTTNLYSLVGWDTYAKCKNML